MRQSFRGSETQTQAEQALSQNGRHLLQPGQLQHLLLLRGRNSLPAGVSLGSGLRRDQLEVRPPQSRRLHP
ncbi:hypothetical protein AVEN_220856-1, partial [Araneus ventricosus]